MKIATTLLALLSLISVAAAEENRYDVVAKTLLPFLNIFAKDRKSENRAFSLTVRIEDASDSAHLKGTSAEIAIETPDKLRLHGALFGDTFTLVRDGEKIWIAPGAKARALLDAAVAGKQLPPPDKKTQLGEFRLPIPEKQLVFLPALLTVKDLGTDAVDGVDCRAMDLSLMPELAKSLDVQGWVARIWARPDYTPSRLTIARKGWHIVLHFDDVKFRPQLDPATWQPSAEEAADVLVLKPSEYSRFLKAIGGSK